MSDSAFETVQFRGMRFLMWGIFIGGIALAISALTGVSALSLSHEGTRVAYHTPATRLLALCLVPVYFAFAYGVYRRALIVWHAGFIILGATFLAGLLGAWTAITDAPLSVRGILVLVAGVVGWLMTKGPFQWWKRQRRYFDHGARHA